MEIIEERKIYVTNLSQEQISPYWKCSQCSGGITQQTQNWLINIERWDNASGKPKLMGQGILSMCNNCYETLKNYFLEQDNERIINEKK